MVTPIIWDWSNVKIFILQCFLISFITFQNVNSECIKKKYIGLLCIKVELNPEDLMQEKTYNPIDLTLNSLTKPTILSIPQQMINSNNKYAEFKTVSAEKFCLPSIEGGFFKALSGSSAGMYKINFNNISCLKTLSTPAFSGIGKSLKYLSFSNMPDLVSIEPNFFDDLLNLEKLKIENTKIMTIPPFVFTSFVKLKELNLKNNFISFMPKITSNKIDLTTIIETSGNPFHCDCALMDFIKSLSLNDENTCASPADLFGKPLNNVGDLCIIKTTKPKLSGVNASPTVKKVAAKPVEASIRLSIIIPAIILVVAIIVTLIFLVIYKRQKDLKEKKKNKQTHSPSKPDIEFQSLVNNKVV